MSREQIELSSFEKVRAFTGDVGSRQSEIDAGEWQLRVDLAATYRLVALYGWDDLVFTHISCRIPGPEKHFLINPYGLLFEEVTASNLVRIDVDGYKVDASPHAVNPAGFAIHSAIHRTHDNAHCVLHLHTDAGMAVAAQADGLLAITQYGMVMGGDLAYHDFGGPGMHADEGAAIAADLGGKHNMILRGHGTLSVGRSCADAFIRAYVLQRACAAQIAAMAGGAPLYHAHQGAAEQMATLSLPSFHGANGDLAWPALLRKLDRIDPGFRM